MIERQVKNIEVYRGDSIDFDVQVLDTDGAPVDVTGYTFRAQIRSHVDGPLLATLSIGVSSETFGKLVVYAAPIELDLGPDNAGVWDLEVTTDGATPIITTSHRGTVTYVLDVTE